MARALSVDLRDRVVAAIAGGLSRGRAAARFGVSAIRWQQLVAEHGTPKPQQQGGDRRSARIEAHADLIMDAYETTSDIALAELQGLLAEHGADVAIGTIRRFFKRRGITRRKRMAAPSASWIQRWRLIGLRKRIRHVGMSAAAQSRRADHPRPLERHRPHHRPLLPKACDNYLAAARYSAS